MQMQRIPLPTTFCQLVVADALALAVAAQLWQMLSSFHPLMPQPPTLVHRQEGLSSHGRPGDLLSFIFNPPGQRHAVGSNLDRTDHA